MTFTFEVEYTDLLGRVGTLRVNGRKVRTPCLLPVVHPIRQIIPVEELRQMGFNALMTNSLIAYTRARREVLEKGLVSFLGYDGVVMTDSGGYQVLEYGTVKVTPKEIAEFQRDAGSDLAMTLDRPTGYSKSRSYSNETMRESLVNSVETIRNVPGGDTTWVGPIQGGLFLDLIKKSARGLLRAGFEFLALGSPTPVMVNYHFDELVRMIIAARSEMPYSAPLHLFGAGHPLTMALSVALGSDTFDSASYVLFAREGRYMTDRGATELREMQFLPCSCQVCNSTSVGDLLLLSEQERQAALARHNLFLLKKELLSCREAIVEGRLWDLLEEKAATHPAVSKAFRILAENSNILEVGTSAFKTKGLMLRSEIDSSRPELALASRRLKSTQHRRKDTAIVVLTARGVPLSKTPGFSRLKRRYPPGDADLYLVHRELGPFPAELQFTYPFSQTVREEEGFSRESVSKTVSSLKRMGYKRVRAVSIETGGRVRVLRLPTKNTPKR
jgi:7-cyano-7-deazaguanine tRNA-ribosyltransferase